jgi:hypothetical protein
VSWRTDCHVRGVLLSRIWVVAAVVLIVASPAFAQSTRGSQAQRPLPSQNPARSVDVYSGDRYLGRDPDPNIRFQLLREQNWRKGG